VAVAGGQYSRGLTQLGMPGPAGSMALQRAVRHTTYPERGPARSSFAIALDPHDVSVMTLRASPTNMETMTESSPDRKRFLMQIRAVMVPYRIELGRRNSRTTEHIRLSGGALLDRLERTMGPDPDLHAALAAARMELKAKVSPAMRVHRVVPASRSLPG
jgi:hypothetical protein